MSKQPLAPPKPKEHGAWGMLYVPLVIAVGSSGTWSIRVLWVALAATLIFLSQRPYSQLLTNRRVRQDVRARRSHLAWLAFYWTASAASIILLWVHYRLEALLYFAWLGIPIAAAFTWFLKTNRTRTVAGELVGICGLTLTAPLAHYASLGHVRPAGFWIWALCVLYFAGSIFYVKARVASSLRARSLPLTRPDYSAFCISYHLGLLGLLAGLAALGQMPVILPVAFLPVVLRGVLSFQKRDAKLNIARIGWTEVAYSLFFALVTVLAIRVMDGTAPL